VKAETKNWLGLAEEDYETSRYLFKGAKYPYAVYLLCQAIEKGLKAALVERTQQAPPKSHDLEILAKKSGLPFSSDHYRALKTLLTHYHRVRYRDLGQAQYNTQAKVEPILKQGQQIYVWILNTFKNR
jgi:HEPN domain-containing protein